MKLIFERRISTLIAGLFQGYARSLPSAVSLACVHCGLRVSARKEVGTSGLGFEIDLDQQRSLPSRHVVVLTPGGNLSISCESSTFDEAESPIRSGGHSGISCLTANYSQPCGCDPGCRLARAPGFYTCELFPECAYGRSRETR